MAHKDLAVTKLKRAGGSISNPHHPSHLSCSLTCTKLPARAGSEPALMVQNTPAGGKQQHRDWDVQEWGIVADQKVPVVSREGKEIHLPQHHPDLRTLNKHSPGVRAACSGVSDSTEHPPLLRSNTAGFVPYRNNCFFVLWDFFSRFLGGPSPVRALLPQQQCHYFDLKTTASVKLHLGLHPPQTSACSFPKG